MIRKVKKVWGVEEWLVNNSLYCLKKLIVRSGGCCSLHAHPLKDETFFCVLGPLAMEVGSRRFRLMEGATVHIPPMTKHRFWVPPHGREAIFFEVSTTHSDDDVIRYEPSRLLS